MPAWLKSAIGWTVLLGGAIGLIGGIAALDKRLVAYEAAKVAAFRAARTPEPCPRDPDVFVIEGCTDEPAINARVRFLAGCGYKVVSEPKSVANPWGCRTTIHMARKQ